MNLHFPYYSPLLQGTAYTRIVRTKWAKATSAANLTLDAARGRILIPKLSQVRIASEDGYQVSAIVDMSTVGKTARELSNKIETVTASLHAYQTRVERLDPAHARITVSFRPPTPPSPHSPQEELDLEQFPIYLDPIGQHAAINLTKSILIGGESESGKSNLVWYILSRLNEYRIPYRLTVIDPAGGVELNDLAASPYTRRYVDRAKDIPEVIDAFHKSMDNRLELMKKRRVRRHFPTTKEPLEICIIDELLLCKAQLKGGDASSPLGEVLSVGRKALHIVMACSQLGQKDVIGQIRDLFLQRICLRTRTQEMTDAVLGTNATQDGANCHRITQRGEGYVFTDTSAAFEKFYAPFVRETAAIAAGGTTAPPQPPLHTSRAQRLRQRRRGRTFLYQLFDQQDSRHPHYNRPCYVGITDNPRRRLKQHERDWPNSVWQTIQHSRTKITAHPTWDEAKDMETALINYYQPRYNIQERSR